MSIESLLQRRSAQFRQESEEVAAARADNMKRAVRRKALTIAIGNDFAAFDPIRRRALKGKSFEVRSAVQGRLFNALLQAKLIVKRDHGRIAVPNADARAYVNGGWLEQLAYFALIESGADEADLNRHITWQVDQYRGVNEIDAIARRGDTLSLVSCKLAHARFDYGRDNEKLRNQLNEAGYWAQHFATDNGRTILMVSKDLIDEAAGDEVRYEALFGRAEAMSVDIVSLDYFRWHRLVARLCDHWE